VRRRLGTAEIGSAVGGWTPLRLLSRWASARLTEAVAELVSIVAAMAVVGPVAFRIGW
jgi:hypothetical protein